MFTWYTIGGIWPEDIDMPPLIDSRGSDLPPETEFYTENWP